MLSSILRVPKAQTSPILRTRFLIFSNYKKYTSFFVLVKTYTAKILLRKNKDNDSEPTSYKKTAAEAGIPGSPAA